MPKPPVKSAFYVTSKATAHYAKLHAMLTDYSPLEISLFTDRGAAAEWLGVPVDALTMQSLPVGCTALVPAILGLV